MSIRKTKTSTAVKRRYNEKTYGVIKAELKKEKVARFKELVKENGDSIAGVVNVAIDAYILKHDKNNVNGD